MCPYFRVSNTVKIAELEEYPLVTICSEQQYTNLKGFPFKSTFGARRFGDIMGFFK